MSLPAAIANTFVHIERLDWRVGTIWLNPIEVGVLRRYWRDVFDIQSSGQLLRAFPGWVGTLYGARVIESAVVPPGRVALAPDGLEGTLVDQSATLSLGPYDSELMTPAPAEPVVGKSVWQLLMEDD